jgi:hypothetical protein
MNIQYTYIVVKCKIYSYELEKQLEKRIFGELFWSVSHRVQVNFIFVYYVYPAISKSLKQVSHYLNIAETSAVIIFLNGVFCEVRGYTITVAYCPTTCIRYQESFIRPIT